MQLVELLSMKYKSLAAEDTKFGEADMVEQSIDTNDQTNQDFSMEVTICSQEGD